MRTIQVYSPTLLLIDDLYTGEVPEVTIKSFTKTGLGYFQAEQLIQRLISQGILFPVFRMTCPVDGFQTYIDPDHMTLETPCGECGQALPTYLYLSKRWSLQADTLPASPREETVTIKETLEEPKTRDVLLSQDLNDVYDDDSFNHSDVENNPFGGEQ